MLLWLKVVMTSMYVCLRLDNLIIFLWNSTKLLRGIDIILEFVISSIGMSFIILFLCFSFEFVLHVIVVIVNRITRIMIIAITLGIYV